MTREERDAEQLAKAVEEMMLAHAVAEHIVDERGARVEVALPRPRFAEDEVVVLVLS